MVLFVVGFICLVAGAVLYLLAEDNGYKKLSKKVDEYNSRMEQ